MSWAKEPCGRCGHDVNAHEEIEGEDVAGECEREGCLCDGFITEPVRTRAKYGSHND